MVIGLKNGKAMPDEEPARQKTYAQVSEVIRKFESLNKTTICRELIGYDLTTDEGMEAARASGIFQTSCLKYIRDTINILEEMGF